MCTSNRKERGPSPKAAPAFKGYLLYQPGANMGGRGEGGHYISEKASRLDQHWGGDLPLSKRWHHR